MMRHAKLAPVLKDMYIKWKSSDSFQMLFGIQSNPSVGVFEGLLWNAPY